MQIEQIWLDAESELLYCPCFLSEALADGLFQTLNTELAWKAEEIKIFGKTHLQPRLLAWYGDAEAHYSYSGIRHEPLIWTPSLALLKEQLESCFAVSFNSVLANKYRNGQDSMGWHSDDEKELGARPIIASLSLGAARRFLFRPRKGFEGVKREFLLAHGSLLLMRGNTQQNWQHSVPKTAKLTGERINLTFRTIRVTKL
jgi:alkylated DNA repair dioxygenase AlkB